MRWLASLACCLVLLLGMILPSEAVDDPIAVIVHKDNKLPGLAKSGLARIYSGEMGAWPDGQKIVVLNRPLDSDLRKQFYRLVLDAEPTAKFFLPGSPIPFETRQVQSDQATRKIVAQIPSAIGYLPLSATDDSVKVLAIDGVLPSQGRYTLGE
jgi:phosphate transport system substrate-binding protein